MGAHERENSELRKEDAPQDGSGGWDDAGVGCEEGAREEGRWDEGRADDEGETRGDEGDTALDEGNVAEDQDDEIDLAGWESRDSTTGYHGVSRDSLTGMFYARVWRDDGIHDLGSFPTAKEATGACLP